MRRRWAVLFFALLLGGTAAPTAANEGIDVLQPREPGKGDLHYHVDLQLQPAWMPAQPEAPGTLYSGYRWSVQAGWQYTLADRLDVTLEGRLDGGLFLSGGGSDEVLAWRVTDMHGDGAAGIAWRAAPDHPWTPTVTVERSLRATGGVAYRLFGRRTADPVVLHAGLAWYRLPGSSVGTRSTALEAGGGLAFVMNDGWGAGVHVGHRFAGPAEPLSATALTLRLHRFAGNGPSTVDWDVTLSEQAGRVVVNFGVGWRGLGRSFLSPGRDG